jgi:hypothetical protein
MDFKKYLDDGKFDGTLGEAKPFPPTDVSNREEIEKLMREKYSKPVEEPNVPIDEVLRSKKTKIEYKVKVYKTMSKAEGFILADTVNDALKEALCIVKDLKWPMWPVEDEEEKYIATIDDKDIKKVRVPAEEVEESGMEYSSNPRITFTKIGKIRREFVQMYKAKFKVEKELERISKEYMEELNDGTFYGTQEEVMQEILSDIVRNS